MVVRGMMYLNPYKRSQRPICINICHNLLKSPYINSHQIPRRNCIHNIQLGGDDKGLLWLIILQLISNIIYIVRQGMISYLVYKIHNTISYEELKRPLQFNNDTLGLTNWIFRLPISIYHIPTQQKHTFHHDTIIITPQLPPIDEKWRYFVITRQNGTRMYCTSQIYYEKGIVRRIVRSGQSSLLESQGEEFYIPCCIVFMSAEPYFKMQVNLLKIHRQLRKNNLNITHPTQPRILTNYLKYKSQGRQHEWINYQHQKQEEKKTIPMDIVMDYYLKHCNDHIFGEAILFEKSNNWPILHLYKLSSQQIFQFSHFLNLPLSEETIRATLLAILLQKQIVITSKSQNLNVMIIESLLQLIKPLKWEHMLVHNLPSHLQDAANQNFMPFIIGVNKKHLAHLNLTEKYVLIVDEDKLVCSEALPKCTLHFQRFPNQHLTNSTPSHLNEKMILESSISFIAKLLQAYIAKDHIYQPNQAFFMQFQATTILARFKEQYQRGELRQYQRLLSLTAEDRFIEISKRLNEVFQIIHNPKILNNEIAWMEYYIEKIQFASENAISKMERLNNDKKFFTLKQIKENITKDSHQMTHFNRIQSLRQRSHSNAQAYAKYSRNNQKLKISMLKNEKGNPQLIELVEQKMGSLSKQ